MPMKRKTLKLVAMIACLASSNFNLPAQIYNQGIVGYYNQVFIAGDNLFAISLLTSSNLSGIFHRAKTLPDGTTVSLWNPTSSTFNL